MLYTTVFGMLSYDNFIFCHISDRKLNSGSHDPFLHLPRLHEVPPTPKIVHEAVLSTSDHWLILKESPAKIQLINIHMYIQERIYFTKICLD